MKKLLLFVVFATAMTGCTKDSDSWDDPVIPVTLKSIEAVNIDNSGELPIMATSPVKKEAYMLGVKWITDNTPTDEDDKFVTDVIRYREKSYGALTGKYSKAIKCNTQFNSNIPAGKYVSKFFKEADRNFMPADIDEGFVLLVAPDPGMHSFRVEYYEGETIKFFYDTPLINFQ